ncbi:hypothetical protein ABBQ32_013000 [Trebouxia sp. C0010 RCD-2024]
MRVDQSDASPLEGSQWCHEFTAVQQVSAGAYGFVWQCREKKTGDLVAIKFISRDRSKIDRNAEREIINHAMLVHPHIIEFKLCFLTDKYLAIAMEYAEGEDLLRLVNRCHGLSEADARWLFQQLMFAVDYMHRMGVANRDIKLENILLKGCASQPILKICDFGYSINENHSLPKTALGTPGYTAPEVLANMRQEGAYQGRPTDVWSSGVVLYAMLFFRYPFDERPGDGPHQRQQLFLNRIQAGDVQIPHDPPVSEECKDLIRRIFTPSPARRITVQEILQHPWFLTGLPKELRMADWNGEVLQSPVYCAQTVEDIRVTVRAALRANAVSPEPKWVQRPASGSLGELSDVSDASEGANF